MKMLKYALSGSLVLALVAPLSARAQQDDPTKPTPAQQFLIKCANMNEAEVQLSQLAKKNAKSEEVRNFAQKMIDNHDKARKDLVEHFKNLKTAVVAKPEEKHKEMYDRLAKLEGNDFDREYMNIQVKMHQQALDFLKANSAAGADPQVRDWSQRQTKDIAEHLKHAQEIQRKLGGAGSDQKEVKDQNR